MTEMIPISEIDLLIKGLEALQPKDRDLWNTVNDYRADMIYAFKELRKKAIPAVSHSKIDEKIKELEPLKDEYTCRCMCDHWSKDAIEILEDLKNEN